MSRTRNTISSYKFGILVDAAGPREWEYECIRRLVEAQLAFPAFVGFLESGDTPVGRSEPDRLRWLLRRRILPRIPSLQKVASQSLIRLVSEANPDVRVFRESYAVGALEKSLGLELDLDFILGFVEPERIAGCASLPRLGVWFFSERGSPLSTDTPVLDSVIARAPATVLSLGAINGKSDEPKTIWNGRHRIDPNAPAHSLEAIFRDISKWPVWACSSMGIDAAPSPDISTSSESVNGSRSPATLGSTLAWPIRSAIGKALHRASEVTLKPQWNIAVLKRPIQSLLSKPTVEDASFLDIPAGIGEFWADPFGIRESDGATIFFEKFDYEANKGNISCLRVTDDGRQGEASTVFDADHHLSYPFIFRHGEDIYCAPESGQAGKVEIYRARSFPERWERVSVLDSLAGVDSTIFRWDGLWWLACGRMEHEQNANLFLYYAEHLTGPWKPHIRNPVKTDVASSRPAGTPFVHEGELYRPAQDCALSYGRRVCINRVISLNTSEFLEEEVRSIEAPVGSGYADGLHTLSAVGDWTLIDGLRRKFAWRGLVRAVRRRLHMTGKP